MSREQLFVDRLSMAACITTLDVDNPVILATNKTHEKLTGWSNADVIGQNPKVFKGPLTEPLHSYQIKESLRTGDCWDGTITNYKKDGSYYRVTITIFPVSVDGQRRYVAVKSSVWGV